MKESLNTQNDKKENHTFAREKTIASLLCSILSVPLISLLIYNASASIVRAKEVKIEKAFHQTGDGEFGFGEADPHLDKLVEKRIATWIAYGKDKEGRSPVANIRRWVSNVSAYREYIKESARKYDIDETFLMALFAWESGGNPRARSSKSAMGFGQFVKVTAQDKGLVVNRTIDERLDPARSIDAAASYIRDAAKRYNSYSFLVTAYYNYGPGNVKKKIRKYGLNKSLFYKLPKETKKHYINIFAIKKLIDKSERYGFTYRVKPSHKRIMEKSRLYVVKKGEDLSSIAKKKGLDIKMIMWKNPKIISPNRVSSGTSIYI